MKTTELRKVSLTELTTNDVTQRVEGVDRRRVDRMAAEFDPTALGVIVVSHRADGSMKVLDGMHRVTAAGKAGYNASVDALVFTGLTRAEEADLFLRYNTKKDPSALSKFKARVTAGDAIAVDIDRIVREAGLYFGRGSRHQHAGHVGAVGAVTQLEQAYTTCSGVKPKGTYPEILADVLFVLTEAWGKNPAAVDGVLIGAVAKVLGLHGEKVDRDRLVLALMGTSPGVAKSRARARAEALRARVADTAAWVVVDTYNGSRRRKGNLPAWEV